MHVSAIVQNVHLFWVLVIKTEIIIHSWHCLQCALFPVGGAKSYTMVLSRECFSWTFLSVVLSSITKKKCVNAWLHWLPLWQPPLVGIRNQSSRGLKVVLGDQVCLLSSNDKVKISCMCKHWHRRIFFCRGSKLHMHWIDASRKSGSFLGCLQIFPRGARNPTLPSAGSVQVNKNSHCLMTYGAAGSWRKWGKGWA